MGPQPFPGFTARADTDESRVAAPGGCTVESVWPLKAAHRSSAFNGSPLPRWPVLVAEEWPKRSLMAPSNELGSGHSGAKVLRLRVTVNPKFARRTVFIVSALDPVDIGHMEVWSNVWWLGADEGQWAAHFQPPPLLRQFWAILSISTVTAQYRHAAGGWGPHLLGVSRYLVWVPTTQLGTSLNDARVARCLLLAACCYAGSRCWRSPLSRSVPRSIRGIA